MSTCAYNGMGKDICPVCNRLILDDYGDDHHLVPKSRGGTGDDKIFMHLMCHSKIHAVFDEKTLARNFNTVEKINAHPEMQKFIKWIGKKPLDYKDKNIMCSQHKKHNKFRKG